ncbi:hypothetical protein KEM55_003069 [Ascosphaera atra]|nr:hypothetical protein KEM55_003069 [Ascosphaera atra]
MDSPAKRSRYPSPDAPPRGMPPRSARGDYVGPSRPERDGGDHYSRDGRRRRSRSRDYDDRRRDSREMRGDPIRDRRGDRSYRPSPRERSTSRDRYSRREPPRTGRPRGYERRGRSPSLSRSRSPRRDAGPARRRSRTPPPRSSRPGREESIDRRDQGDTTMTDADEGDIEAMLQKTMGFSSFKTTQNQKVPGNNVYGVRKEKKTQYRQYMNRLGGFNRPLSPTR